MAENKVKALALLSGGLDSTLSALIMQKHGVEVKGIVFVTPFSSSEVDLRRVSESKRAYYSKVGIDVDVYEIVEEYFEIVKNPLHGYGKNLNPCVDCKILFLRKTKELLGIYGANFIITGEVLGQRSMSQMLNTLLHIEREAGVEGLVVRPLSGKLLPPTKPELDGIIKREWLMAIKGRGRKEQLELARELGLTEFQQPAGGCLLTVPSFSERLRKVLLRNELDQFHVALIKLGRHFFVNGRRLVIGRNEKENQQILRIASGKLAIFEPISTKGPVAVFESQDLDLESLSTILGIVARYCDEKENVEFFIKLPSGENFSYRIEKSFHPSEVEKFRN
ncbi:MAG: tRNA 4-thiouridine(8) synthase ThiI [bacterium]|nr:tRNA 4-thiouridine(8) synthase ThiI [bacterium]